MRPNRYPYNKKPKRSNREVVVEIATPYLEYVSEIAKKKTQSKEKNKHIEVYIQLRKGLSPKEWDDLNGLYEHLLFEKKHKLTKGLALDPSEIEAFRSYAQRLNEINE